MTSISCGFARQIHRTFPKEVTVYRAGDVTRASGVVDGVFVTITDSYLLGRPGGQQFARVADAVALAEGAERSRWTTSVLDEWPDASPARIKWISEYNQAFAREFPGEVSMNRFSAMRIAHCASPELAVRWRGAYVVIGDVVVAPSKWPDGGFTVPRRVFEVIADGNMRPAARVTALVSDAHFVVRTPHSVAIWRR